MDVLCTDRAPLRAVPVRSGGVVLLRPHDRDWVGCRCHDLRRRRPPPLQRLEAAAREETIEGKRRCARLFQLDAVDVNASSNQTPATRGSESGAGISGSCEHLARVVPDSMHFAAHFLQSRGNLHVVAAHCSLRPVRAGSVLLGCRTVPAPHGCAPKA